jgi:LysR family transcriptional regulator, glycine cleavage system transcriptional activator
MTHASSEGEMKLRLPPVAAIRALEAAARHQSFTLAADELHITPSAISHQIRYLEDLWAVKLFDRGKRLELTPAGKTLVPIVREFLDRMAGALSTLHASELRESLRVSTTQSFAVKWLVPRLPDFNAKHPNISIWITASDELANFVSDNIDIAVRLGHGSYPGLHTTFLFREYVFPVCSPAFLERGWAPTNPKDLLSYPLLLRSGSKIVPTWEYWFQLVGIMHVKLEDGVRFPDTSMTIEAALSGQGIALVRSAHVADDLAAGRLVKLFDVPCPSNVAYYFVCPNGTAALPKIVALREWLLGEAEKVNELYARQAGVGEDQASYTPAANGPATSYEESSKPVPASAPAS